MVIGKYREDDIIWEVVGGDVYKELKAKLKPNKKRNLHTNNLPLDKFTSGCWIEFESKYTKDERYIVVNDNYKIRAYKCRIYVSHVDQEMSHKAVPALSKVKEKFIELSNISFKRAFGTVNENILRCIPKQFYWAKSDAYEGIINSIDFSSHYPASLCGIIPDSHEALQVKGTVKPNKDYPFAFYINSGHMAIYNELDTHNWLFDRNFEIRDLFRLKTKRKSFDDRFNEHIVPKDDITVLMKASKYNLKNVYEHFYKIKQMYDKDSDEYNEAKSILVASIGQMHRKKYVKDKYAHLAAVGIARANQHMLDVINKNQLKLDDIIQIQVDGVLYKGTQKLGIEDSYLGAIVQEAYQRPCRWIGTGAYMIDLGDKMKIKHQCYDVMSDGRSPDCSTKFSDMDLWVKRSKNEEVND